jgi:hypothetical protein
MSGAFCRITEKGVIGSSTNIPMKSLKCPSFPYRYLDAAYHKLDVDVRMPVVTPAI